jgi:hypothetical protein
MGEFEKVPISGYQHKTVLHCACSYPEVICGNRGALSPKEIKDDGVTFTCLLVQWQGQNAGN